MFISNFISYLILIYYILVINNSNVHIIITFTSIRFLYINNTYHISYIFPIIYPRLIDVQQTYYYSLTITVNRTCWYYWRDQIVVWCVPLPATCGKQSNNIVLAPRVFRRSMTSCSWFELTYAENVWLCWKLYACIMRPYVICS